MTEPPSPPPNSWAARTDADVAIWTLKMAPGARWTLPPAAAGTNRTLYFFRGKALSVGGRAIAPLPRGDAAPRRRRRRSRTAPDEAELLVLQGRPIGEPVAQYGPFVMNSRAEIQQAIGDYQRTQFGGWPFASDDPVHAREEPRFARHADGRIEEPSQQGAGR